METNNTPSKEEILGKYVLSLSGKSMELWGTYDRIEVRQKIIAAMQEYSDSQNKALIEERDSWKREVKIYYESKIEAEKRATELTGIAENALSQRDKYKEMCGEFAEALKNWTASASKYEVSKSFEKIAEALTKYNNLIK